VRFLNRHPDVLIREVSGLARDDESRRLALRTSASSSPAPVLAKEGLKLLATTCSRKTCAACLSSPLTRVRFSNGTRANLHNSSTRFHCALIIGSLAPSGRPTGPVVVAAGAWFEPSTFDLEVGLRLCRNPLISRRMSETISNCRFFSSSPTYLSFEDVSGWYGSRTGADDLWVLPKPEPRPFTLGHQPCCRGSVAADHSIQTRVSCPPRALRMILAA
jgi:hypothetical protein